MNEDKLARLKAINSSVVDRRGQLKSFKDQLLSYSFNKFPIGKPFVIAGDSSSISYIQGVEETKPIILTQKALSHIKGKHLEDYQTLFDLTEGLENSWLSMDSKRYDTSKLIVLGDNLKSPYISVCRIDSTIDGIAVNRINTFYKKENFLDLLISTYNLGKNIYCNKKTEAIVRSEEGFQLPTDPTPTRSEEGFQLPTEIVELLYNNHYMGALQKSQSPIFQESVRKFTEEQKDAFSYDGKTYLPIHQFSGDERSLRFIAALYTRTDSINIDYEEFYRASPVKQADLFYCLNTGQVYMPTDGSLMLVPRNNLSKVQLSSRAEDIMRRYAQQYCTIDAYIQNREVCVDAPEQKPGIRATIEANKEKAATKEPTKPSKEHAIGEDR